MLNKKPRKIPPMTNCNTQLLLFPKLNRRKIQAQFTGGDLSSDGGGILLKQVDERLGLTKRLSQLLKEERNPDLIVHPLRELLAQRIYGLALGYEDINDHEHLRKDSVLQLAVGTDQVLASSSTLCRLEARADRQKALQMHQVMIEQFIDSFKEPPKELILDFDSTDDRVHGQQEGRAYHGYYGGWCFLPLYVFCGEQLLVSYLRASNRDGATHAWAILKLLRERFKEVWPEVKIILRADSGFCRWKMLRWCEGHGVKYIVGLAKNERLLELIEEPMQVSAQACELSHQKQRHFGRIEYAAKSWDRKRWVIYKAEHTQRGANPRFVVSNLEGDPQWLYDEIYCARGEMENRIKEQQLGLFADRTSCHLWWANQFRLLLSSAAYSLLEALRRLGLKRTELAKAQVQSIRIKLLKIGTIILKNTRRIQLLYSSAYPYQGLFRLVVSRLNST